MGANEPPAKKAGKTLDPGDTGAKGGDVVPMIPRQRRRCLVCGQAAVHKYRPFCSAACADRDLGRWLSESYRVPADDAGADGPTEDDGGQDDGGR